MKSSIRIIAVACGSCMLLRAMEYPDPNAMVPPGSPQQPKNSSPVQKLKKLISPSLSPTPIAFTIFNNYPAEVKVHYPLPTYTFHTLAPGTGFSFTLQKSSTFFFFISDLHQKSLKLTPIGCKCDFYKKNKQITENIWFYEDGVSFFYSFDDKYVKDTEQEKSIIVVLNDILMLAAQKRAESRKPN